MCQYLCNNKSHCTMCQYLSNQSHSVMCQYLNQSHSIMSQYPNQSHSFQCQCSYIFSKHYQQYVLILFEFLWLFHLYLSLWVLNSLISTILTQTFFMIIIFIFSGFVIFCLSVLYCFPCQAYIPDDFVVSPCPVSLIQ